MASFAEPFSRARPLKLRSWLALAAIAASVLLIGVQWPAWIWMWALALSVFAGLKWLTYADSTASKLAAPRRAWGYLLLWPGMNADAFLADSRTGEMPLAGEWGRAAAKSALGLVLVVIAVVFAESPHVLFAGWLGGVSIVLGLHFGLFHLLSILWRRAGVDAPPIMDRPMLSRSLGEFWGRRWNRAFRDVVHPLVFRPLQRRLGFVGATMGAFLASGVIHDLVISVPARGGWGLPTMYFLLQGLAVLLERSAIGKRFQLRRGVRGRLFAATVVLAPAPLLFHAPFIERIVVPMLSALGGK